MASPPKKFPLASPKSLFTGRKLGFWQQVALIFFTVSGGAYGLEAMFGAVGAKWTLILILIVPLLWAVPVALVSAELSAALPKEGGYYVWVRRGLGSFWGFQEGWWTLCYSMVDLAVYPVLFVTYLGVVLNAYFPHLHLTEDSMLLTRVAISLAFISVSLLINLNGSRTVGRGAAFSFILVGLPFLILVIWGALQSDWHRVVDVLQETGEGVDPVHSFTQIAAGIAIALWNYSGWDNTSTYAEEVEDPQRNYPRALFASLILITLLYLLPLLIGFKATLNPADWSDTAGWPVISAIIGGRSFGLFIGGVALISVWALFNSQLLYLSRLPIPMAEDGWLPKSFAKISSRGAPVTALLVLAACATVFSTLSFSKLMVVDILFYALGLSLEFAAVICLRKNEPDLVRPFRIPLGPIGLLFLSAPPLILAGIVAVTSLLGGAGSWLQLALVAAGLFMGLVVYYSRRPRSVSKMLP